LLKNFIEIRESAETIKSQIRERYEAKLDLKEKQEKENLLYLKQFEENKESERQEKIKLKQKRREMIEEVMILNSIIIYLMKKCSIILTKYNVL